MIEQALRTHFKALDVPLLERVHGLRAVPPKLLRKTTREHSAPFAKKLGTGSFMQVMTTADSAVVRKFGTDCYGLRGQLMLRRNFPNNPHFMRHVEYLGMFECDEHPPLFWQQRRVLDMQKSRRGAPPSLIAALEALFWVAGRMGRTYLDLQTKGIMVRPSTGDLVFSDPFAYRDWTN